MSQIRSGKFFSLQTFLTVIGLIFLSSCGNSDNQQQQSQAPDVDFYELQNTSAQTEKTYPGTIEGEVNVDIKVQATGYLEAIYVKEGDYVQKGQSLFKIKADVYNQQVSTGQAALQSAVAVEENAKIELQKIKPLVDAKVYSEVQLQTAEANLAAAKAQVAQAKSLLQSSQIDAGFTLIKAPVSGYIGRIPNRVGNLVTPTDAVPLTTLSEIKNVYVYFSLSEADFITFTKQNLQQENANDVNLVLADGSLYNHRGKLEFASGNIDRSTGSIAMKAIFPNPDKLLRSGGSGKIILSNSVKDVLVIPIASVKDLQDRFFVFSLTDSNKVVMKPIEISGKTGNNYIVKSGLKQGEKIALNRIDALSDKTLVTPKITTSISAQ